MKNTLNLNTNSALIALNQPDYDQFEHLICPVESQEKRKMAITSLCNELLKIRDKNSLHLLLSKELRKIFNYIDFEILLRRENQITFDQFMTLGSPNGLLSNRPDNVLTAEENLTVPIDMVAPNSSASLFMFRQPHVDNELLTFLKDRKPTNCDHCLVLSLNNAFDIFGLLIFYFDQNPVSEEIVKAANKITPQFTNILSHIITYEKKISTEKEKILINAISEELGMARDKNDLARAFNGRLKSLLLFNSGIIGIIDNVNNTYSPFLNDDTNKNHPKGNNLKKSNYAIKDPIMEGVLSSDRPVLYGFDDMPVGPEMPDYIRTSHENGCREMAIIPLKSKDGIIGFAALAYNQKNQFTEKAIEVLKYLSPILSTAMSNILLKEHIDHENFQKSVLAALTLDMAITRNKEDLLNVINTQLKKLIYFTHNNMGIISEDGKTYEAFLLDPNSRARKSAFYNEILSMSNDMNDYVYEQAVKSGRPVVIDMDSFIDKNPPLWFKINYETGAREIAMTVLPGEEWAKYILILFSDKKNNFDRESLEIIEHISCHLATAVANIKANEEILEREKERSILLSLSHDMAALRNKQDLLNIIQTKLTDYFDVNCFHVSIINQDMQSHSIFLTTRRGKPLLPEDLNVISKKRFQIREDEAFERVTLSDDPVLYSLKRLNKYPVVPDYIRFYMDNSIDQLIGVRLKVANKTIGCAWLQTASRISLALLKGVCAQLSVAMFNMLANEQIISRLEEINVSKSSLQDEDSNLVGQIHTSNNYDEIIGSSPCMQEVYDHISQVAKSTSTVLLMGETGTGKELIARAIHMSSLRADKPMVKVNCAAIPASLIESELFGHERGSFTGATERRVGKFELANNSTLFLDEIGEMPLELQVKLLRAIQEREIERVGGKQTIKVNVRIIAATNRELEKEVNAGRFRSDLFYRLNVFPINLPPLRERKDDIIDLAMAFLDRYSRNSGKNITSISQKVQQELLNYYWPGNIRELEHLMERSVLMTTDSSLKEIFLPKKNLHEKGTKDEFSFKTIKQNEIDHIIKTLKKCGGKLSGDGGAAKFLGVPVSTLSSKLIKLQITKAQIFQK
ncbi:sigma 54-interacting transcriptional regulator [Mucilaginibacter sp.]|uniref:sigma-54-dependent Fis family transcriptional regulator n=1 Tax=Mucilaginibacter sp. TaxID=1882438 RepID=UPI00260199D3|nr:sigma 54-interacting transcriptional regulator [Mucilaginibacter sp.]MDB4922951.1 family ATPase [Mucilaginibacter sp.]